MEKNKSLWAVPIMILLIFVFQQFASGIGRLVASFFTYDRIDPYNLFAWVSVHHIVQMAIALVAIGFLVKVKNLDFGCGLGDVKVGLEHTLNFSVFLFVYVLVFYIITFVFSGFFAPNYPLNLSNVAGRLGFQLLLSGPSEEILFRALPITLLAYCLKSSKFITINKKISGVSSFDVTLETFIVALLFAIAHIGWEINPFSITHLYVHQLILSFAFGIFYGVAYQKSKSVIYPMIMHSMSNVVIVGARYILSIFFG